ncbi:hypothetical protein Salat_2622800 [Sesamum alatum]|uniref:DUF7887 domain-containing protein n=1 Tax=Sesamum alatum TaxID=300844 RepID=A0AAE1XPK7_9LAMI|nr:hypothetical protein Salat_2622800 [Sesamum alatum]
MLITDIRFLSSNTLSCLNSNRNYTRKPYVIPPTVLAKKKDSYQTPNKAFRFPSTKLLIQSAVGLFALGFIDAGYSGDWSRIGVISRGAEDLIKAATFVVVPFCLFLIFSLSKKDEF